MANILVVPVCAHVELAQVSAALAAALPNAAVFNALDNTLEAEKLIGAGLADDWFDLLVGRVAALGKDNVVIQGIMTDADRAFLSAQNVGLATSFNARVVFAASNECGTATRLKLAKQLFTGRNVEP